MRQWPSLVAIALLGLTACMGQRANRSQQNSAPSQSPAPSSPTPEPPITDTPIPASAPSPPTASEAPPPVEDTTPAPARPATPVDKNPARPTDKATPTSTTAKPSATKPVKEKRAPTNAPAAASPSAAVAPTQTAAPSASKPQLDFKAMEQRLRNTSAIGVFTKLSIKNQVDDLLKAFRGYHAGRTPPTLDDLRQRYDGLLLKVVSLIQNDDPDLASSISASRNVIWERLANRESFESIS